MTRLQQLNETQPIARAVAMLACVRVPDTAGVLFAGILESLNYQLAPRSIAVLVREPAKPATPVSFLS